MKTIAFLRVAILSAAILALTSCSNPERDFQKAEQSNTEQAYEKFLQRHPDSPLVPRARSNLAKVSYENAKRTNTVAALEFFLSRFPSGELSTNARTDLENLEFELAGRANTELAWSGFLKKYTNSTHIAAGRENLGECAFQRVSRENTVGAYEAFVRDFEGTEVAKKGRTVLMQLDYQAALKQNTVSSLTEFLAKHPDSPNAPEAKNKRDQLIEEDDWKRTATGDNLGSYLRFFASHTNTTRVRIYTGPLSAEYKLVNVGGSFPLLSSANGVIVRVYGETFDVPESEAQSLGLIKTIRRNSVENGVVVISSESSLPTIRARVVLLKMDGKYKLRNIERTEGTGEAP